MSKVRDNSAPKMILGAGWGARDRLPFLAKAAQLMQNNAGKQFHNHVQQKYSKSINVQQLFSRDYLKQFCYCFIDYGCTQFGHQN